jgi:hypothetical protein
MVIPEILKNAIDFNASARRKRENLQGCWVGESGNPPNYKNYREGKD